MTHPIAIVGGGLAGLTVARRLHQAGMDFILLEARDRLGGRIWTVANGHAATPGYDLGAAWYWPDMQPAMAALIGELELASFPQNSDGDIVFERTRQEGPQRHPGFGQLPVSMRVAGGTGAVVSAIAAKLPADAIRLNTSVTGIATDGDGIRLAVAGPEGQSDLRASHVVLALPPRILEKTISLSPPVERNFTSLWRAMPTWMAPHAKFLAFYERPFWRALGLSGTAQSMVGPLGEIHDATTAGGDAALFGFVGLTADQRASIGPDRLAAACIDQLGRLFGPEGRTPFATRFQDWANDEFTATADDRMPTEHPTPHPGPWIGAPWAGRVFFAGSETSLSEPGYLSGAVAAAERSADHLKRAVLEAAPARVVR